MAKSLLRIRVLPRTRPAPVDDVSRRLKKPADPDPVWVDLFVSTNPRHSPDHPNAKIAGPELETYPDTFRVRRLTVYGEWVTDPVVRHRRGRPQAKTPDVDGVSVRLVPRDAMDLDALAAARYDVFQALAFNRPLQLRPDLQVRPSVVAGRIYSVPAKGTPTRWASVDALAQAIVSGLA